MEPYSEHSGYGRVRNLDRIERHRERERQMMTSLVERQRERRVQHFGALVLGSHTEHNIASYGSVCG